MINVHEGDRERLIRLLTDFNQVRDHNQLIALGRHASQGWEGLGVGDYVLAYDGDGNECLAYVEARRGADLFDLRADFDTWVPCDQPKIRLAAAIPASAEILVPAGIG
jgi:hypothetical protein